MIGHEQFEVVITAPEHREPDERRMGQVET
jgi:hypothetical protein